MNSTDMKPLRSACLKHALVLIAFSAAANPSLADGGPGNALHFDGVDDYVSVMNDNVFNSVPITVATWVRTSQSAGAVDLVRPTPGPASSPTLPARGACPASSLKPARAIREPWKFPTR